MASNTTWLIMVTGVQIYTQHTLRWRHNGRDSVSNHQPHHCLLNRLFRRRSKKTSKLRVTGLCAGNSPVTGEFPAQMASNAENVSIWWRHHVWALVCQSRHQGQGQVITSDRYYGVELLVPVLDICTHSPTPGTNERCHTYDLEGFYDI